MGRMTNLSCGALLLAICHGMAVGQDADAPDRRVDAPQVASEGSDVEIDNSGTQVLFEAIRTAVGAPSRSDLTRTDDDEARITQNNEATPQISDSTQSKEVIIQSPKADVLATLSQLSPSERRILFEAVEGSDICDDSPQVPAVITLCEARLEMRFKEFMVQAMPDMSAEEQLLREDPKSRLTPSVGQVVERLARGDASNDDLNNQAIAAIALSGATAAPSEPGDALTPAEQTLGEQTQALINALIEQLSGGGR